MASAVSLWDFVAVNNRGNWKPRDSVRQSGLNTHSFSLDDLDFTRLSRPFSLDDNTSSVQMRQRTLEPKQRLQVSSSVPT
jgi:hypothetical protein